MQPSGKAGAGRAVDRSVLRRRAADADAGDAAARPAEHRHPGRATRTTRSPIRTCCRWTSRSRRCSRTRTTAPATCAARRRCPTASTRPLIDIADWDFRWQHVYRFVTPLRAAEGDDAVDALHLRQLGGQRAQPAAAAGARALGPAIGRRDGRPLDPGADARRARISSSLSRDFRPKVAAEDVKGYEVEIEKHPGDVGAARRCGAAVSRAGQSDGAIAHFKASLALQAAVGGRALQPRHGADASRAGSTKRPTNTARRCGSIRRTRTRTTTSATCCWRRRSTTRRSASSREVVRLQPESAAAKKNLAAAKAIAAR